MSNVPVTSKTCHLSQLNTKILQLYYCFTSRLAHRCFRRCRRSLQVSGTQYLQYKHDWKHSHWCRQCNYNSILIVTYSAQGDSLLFYFILMTAICLFSGYICLLLFLRVSVGLNRAHVISDLVLNLFREAYWMVLNFTDISKLFPWDNVNWRGMWFVRIHLNAT